jgi:hypothetical protein
LQLSGAMNRWTQMVREQQRVQDLVAKCVHRMRCLQLSTSMSGWQSYVRQAPVWRCVILQANYQFRSNTLPSYLSKWQSYMVVSCRHKTLLLIATRRVCTFLVLRVVQSWRHRVEVMCRCELMLRRMLGGLLLYVLRTWCKAAHRQRVMNDLRWQVFRTTAPARLRHCLAQWRQSCFGDIKKRFRIRLARKRSQHWRHA